jgi:hypothetical protein
VLGGKLSASIVVDTMTISGNGLSDGSPRLGPVRNGAQVPGRLPMKSPWKVQLTENPWMRAIAIGAWVNASPDAN